MQHQAAQANAVKEAAQHNTCHRKCSGAACTSCHPTQCCEHHKAGEAASTCIATVLSYCCSVQIGVHGLIINFYDHETRLARNATFLPEVADHEVRLGCWPTLTLP